MKEGAKHNTDCKKYSNRDYHIGASLPAVGLHYYALTLQMETARRAEPNHEVAIKVNI